jgi:GT2 family glycosyltransferase
VSAAARGAGERVYVVVLNWNGWRDTVACLESVLRSDHADYQVVVCDNASGDESLARLAAWAGGEPVAPAPDPHDPLAALVSPPLPKPVPHAVLTRAEAERGGTAACEAARVVFVQTGANLGYAGGCNVGARYALARGDAAHVWVLNNDTVVAPDALSALVRRLAERPDAGQCGSRVLYYDAPDRVQTWGGATYNPWLGTMRQIGEGEPAAATPSVADVERRTDYVCGASVLVRREFLERVGLMTEDYFLYFEELDWARRGAAFPRAYAHGSVVYHREGRSIGTSADWRSRSVVADYYGLRNRLRFTRRFFPLAFPLVYCGVAGAALNRLLRRQFRRATMVVGILVGRGSPPSPTAPPQPAAPRDRRDLAPS